MTLSGINGHASSKVLAWASSMGRHVLGQERVTSHQATPCTLAADTVQLSGFGHSESWQSYCEADT